MEKNPEPGISEKLKQEFIKSISAFSKKPYNEGSGERKQDEIAIYRAFGQVFLPSTFNECGVTGTKSDMKKQTADFVGSIVQDPIVSEVANEWLQVNKRDVFCTDRRIRQVIARLDVALKLGKKPSNKVE